MAKSRGRIPRGSKTAKVSQNTQVLCGCGCRKKLSRAQRARHMRGLAPGFIAANSAYRRTLELSYIWTGLMSDTLTVPEFLSEGNVSIANRDGGSDENMDFNNTGLDYDTEDDEHVIEDVATGEHGESMLNVDIPLALRTTAQGYRGLRDTEISSDSELENLSENGVDEEDYLDDHLYDDPFGWSLVNEELTSGGDGGLSAEELLGEEFEREAVNNENRISEEDLHILRAFQFKHRYFLSQNAFKAMPFVYPQIHTPSLERIKSRITFLSGLEAVAYDCCINSCCCFIGSYVDDDSCRFCNEPRYTEDGKTARKTYRYIPLIPRLCGMYENIALCKELLYRHEYQHPQSTSSDHTTAITDVWDGRVYKDLRDRHIKINGRELQAKYFSDPHDLALGLTTDGFSPWRRRKYTAWPILIIVYNIPPEKRNLKDNIIPVSVIPGPKKPKDIDSFLYPLVEELLQLSNGVRAFDASTGALFCLRAFLILAFGDIPAISLLMKMKGHNGISPCRSCNIHGLRIPGTDSSNKMHYVPLDRSSHPEAGRIPKYDSNRLPMRTHAEFLINAQSVITARTRAEEDILAKFYGIKGKTILIALDSLSFPSSFPYNFMHLIYENLIKNLISLWTNDYKDLGVGTGSYTLSAAIWDAIGASTAKASDTIPSVYSARFGSISGDRSTFTADNYSFWALYIGPILLQRRFNHQQYYDHFIQLVQLLHVCLKYEYTLEDVKMIREGFAQWVVTYESLYYQYSPARMSACPLSIHALLHIADGIEACGPVWAYWAFPMERYCGLLQRAVLSSRRHPYVTLDKFIVEDAMLTQLKMRYNLYSELSLQPQKHEIGHSFPTYHTCTLLHPHSIEPLPSNVRNRILAALATRYNVQKSVAKRHLPQRIDQWGKVRRTDGGGDTMVAALLGRTNLDRRDATHVRYEALVDLHARSRKRQVELKKETFYGQLLRIFCFTVAASEDLKLPQEETVIFVEIQPCKIISRHSVLDIKYYRIYETPSVFDVTCIQCLVGRVKLDSGSNASEWAIFDRSGTLAQAYYSGNGSEDS